MNNIGVYLTEKQIRTLVRQELKTVLLEQSILLEIEQEEQESSGILNTIKKTGPLIAALLAIATAAGHSATQPASAGDSTEQGTGGGMTIEDQLLSKGINPAEAKKMISLGGLGQDKVLKLHKLLQSKISKDKNVRKIEQALMNNNYSEEDIKKLETALKQEKSGSEYYSQQISNDKEMLEAFLNTGIIATNYLMNKGEISNDLMSIQQDILKYGLEQSEGIALQTAEDDIYRFNKEYVKKDFYLGNSGISDPKDLAMSWLVTHDKEFQTRLTQNPEEEFTAIEIATALDAAVPEFKANVNSYFIPDGQALKTANAAAKESGDTVTGMKALENATDYQEKMNVGQEITPEQAKNMSEEEINKLPPEARQAVRDMKSGIKENKLNKLRQRINELRGVYV